VRATATGFFGSERFGYGYFGVASTPVLFSGTIVSSGLLAALSQEVENVQRIGTTVTIGGVDYSSYAEYVMVQIKEDCLSPTATVSLIGEFTIATAAAVTITSTYSFSDGTTFTTTIFSGKVRSSQPLSGSRSKTTQVYCYDATSDLLAAAKHNTSWTGTAQDFVIDELETAGITNYVLDFADYTIPTGLTFEEFTSVRDIVLAVAGGREEVVLYVGADGVTHVRNYKSSIVSAQSIGLKGVTYYQSYENDDDKYASVTIQAPDGTSYTATDASGKATYSASSKFCEDAADCQAKADEILARSLLKSYSLQVPENPIVKIGGGISVKDLTDTELFAGRITGITHTMQWTGQSSPGCWTDITLRSDT